MDFETDIAELESKINELRHISGSKGNLLKDINSLEFKAKKLIKDKYSTLSPWQRVQVARHPDRPHFLHYIEELLWINYTRHLLYH